MTAVWPLPDLCDHLRGLHDLGANEAADRLEALDALLVDALTEREMVVARTAELDAEYDAIDAQLAAVVAALDQYVVDATQPGYFEQREVTKFWWAIAGAVGR